MTAAPPPSEPMTAAPPPSEPMTAAPPLLRVRDVSVWHRRRRFGRAAFVPAVDGVSLHITAGESLGLVGETGCGKSTLGRAVAQLIAPRSGSIVINGDTQQQPGGDTAQQKQQMRRRVQMVFQDPQSSLNPRRSVAFSVCEPLIVHRIARGGEARRIAAQALEWVGLDAAVLARYPHQLSGGQRQRVGIARAMILRPQLIVADEPVSALDMSVQAQALNLMQALKAQFQLSYLFISHDLAVVGHLCERVAVMYAGKIVETAPRRRLFAAAAHPYTHGLLASALPPRPGVRLQPIRGESPDPANRPSGCHFHPRCPHATEHCRRELPRLRPVAVGHEAACHHFESIAAAQTAATQKAAGAVQ